MNHNTFRNNEKAEVGIGAMIVFIATVLVAAVAASVLVNVSGDLQSNSLKTGKDATAGVATTANPVSIYGKRSCPGGCDSADPIDSVQIVLSLGSGSDYIDLSRLKIRFNDGITRQVYAFDTGNTANCATASGCNPDALEFGAFQLTATAGPTSTLVDGALVQIVIDSGFSFAPNAEVTLDFVPEVGSPIPVKITSPAAYGTNTVFQLF